MNHLTNYLTQQDARGVMLLPPRPQRFIGRTALLQEIVDALRAARTGWYAITGMPGIGKTALASEALHAVITKDCEGPRVFPDAMAAFSGTGRRGIPGLIALLQEIIKVFDPSSPIGNSSETDLARVIELTRMALAGKRVLLLLDDLEPQFPLRQACEALLAQNSAEDKTDCAKREVSNSTCVVLATSRYIPSPALATRHFHVEPMDVSEACELFAALLGRPLYSVEQVYAGQVCAAVGYLPLAIEAAATAVATAGVPLSLLAHHAARHPLDRALDGEREIRAALEKALGDFDPEVQKRFALLATLGIQSFALESASAIITNPIAYRPDRELDTAADLGQLVRHSVIELLPYNPSATSSNSAISTILLPQARAPSFYEAHSYDARYQLHPLFFAHAMERLEQLEPEVVRAAQRNVQAYALTYVERYQGDVPLLERERDFLLATLAQLWHGKQFTGVVRLTEGLAYLAGRLSNPAQGKQILLWGIHACQHTDDQQHLAYFLNRLGGLYMSWGEYAEAFQTWKESMAIANQLGKPAYLWEPLCSLVYIADMVGDDMISPYDAAQRFAETILLAQDAEDADSIATALFIRGFFARHSGARDSAYQDFSACLRALSTQQSGNPLYQRFFEMEVQTELARLRGDYTRSREYTEETVAFAQGFCDPYTVAELVVDQALFAYQQGMVDDLSTWSLRLIELVQPLKAPHLHRASIFLQQVSAVSPVQIIESRFIDKVSSKTENRSPNTSLPFGESLSQRELDVLQLLATGLSNREVATQLVVTTSTVKKHLEHIYNKLDVHNRTQAIVKARAAGLLV